MSSDIMTERVKDAQNKSVTKEALSEAEVTMSVDNGTDPDRLSLAFHNCTLVRA